MTQGKKAKKLGRKPLFKDHIVHSVKIEKGMMSRLKDLAAAETIIRGKLITVHGLIRDAIDFVYEDNERLREVFRKARLALQSMRSWEKSQKIMKSKKLETK